MNFWKCLFATYMAKPAKKFTTYYVTVLTTSRDFEVDQVPKELVQRGGCLKYHCN